MISKLMEDRDAAIEATPVNIDPHELINSKLALEDMILRCTAMTLDDEIAGLAEQGIRYARGDFPWTSSWALSLQQSWRCLRPQQRGWAIAWLSNVRHQIRSGRVIR
jgi:hypothetical protein